MGDCIMVDTTIYFTHNGGDVFAMVIGTRVRNIFLLAIETDGI